MVKKKRANSKALGNAYERDFAKKLSKWLTGSDEELAVWRNVHSGTVGTVRAKKGQSSKNVDGDLQCLDDTYSEFFKVFHIDTKTFKDWNPFLINPKNQKSNILISNWLKTCKEAGQAKKVPIMPVKIRNSTPEFIVLPSYVIVNYNSIIKYTIEIIEKDVELNHFINFVIILQDEFFCLNDWKTFLKHQQKFYTI